MWRKCWLRRQSRIRKLFAKVSFPQMFCAELYDLGVTLPWIFFLFFLRGGKRRRAKRCCVNIKLALLNTFAAHMALCPFVPKCRVQQKQREYGTLLGAFYSNSAFLTGLEGGGGKLREVVQNATRLYGNVCVCVWGVGLLRIHIMYILYIYIYNYIYILKASIYIQGASAKTWHHIKTLIDQSWYLESGHILQWQLSLDQTKLKKEIF